MAAARLAIARDTIERAEQSGAFGGIILVADRGGIACGLDPAVTVELSEEPFHFGRELREVISRHNVRHPFYIGGGCFPLLSAGELGALGRRLSAAEGMVLTNNLFSADIVAFTPGEAIDAIPLPETDNLLAQLLVRHAGLKQFLLPHSAAYQFDVDTPTDLLVLRLHPGPGRHTRECVDGLELDTSRLEAATRCFGDENAEVLVAGRVGSHVWSHLERETSCRVRFLAEERGMRADERQSRGEVRSILGFYLEQVGLRRFFDSLGELGDAAFIDSRVILGHLGLEPSRADRFYSDLGQAENIENPFLREFTLAALEAPIPVVLGGHSLVSGGLLALIDIARSRSGAVDNEGEVG